MCSPTIAHWRHLANMIKLVLPSAYPSPQSKRQIERFSHFFAQVTEDSLSSGRLAPPVEYDWTCASFGPLESRTKTANRSVQPFLHSSRQKVPILDNRRPYPSELPLPMGVWTSMKHMIPWVHASPKAKRHLDRFSEFCTDDHRMFLYFTMVCQFPPKNCSFPLGNLDPM